MGKRDVTSAPTDIAFHPRTDRVTFEVLRHRLWQINDEQGRTIVNVSGSPVASEVNDFNVALADPEGALVFLGPYLIHHTGAISVVIRSAITLLGDEVGEGDMYLCNDPWMGALHQNDVCVIAPVHWQGRLMAWTACTVHQVDVGGPAAGSWSLSATNAFEEAPRYRFLRVMRAGRIQQEVVDTYLTNSRTPHLLELDLRAMIASSNVAKARLDELFRRYGGPTVSDVMQDCLDYAGTLFRRRLRDIPDGEWYAEDYLEHTGRQEKVHAIRLRLGKARETLTFDYRDTDDQAEGFINCTYAGCLAGTLSPVLTQICRHTIPWNEGVIRCLTLLAREGSLNHARFPAPVGMGTISGCHHTHNVATAAVAKMLACSETLRANLMANWPGSAYVYNVFGVNQRGVPFGTMMVDSHLGGAGARYTGDGYHTAGVLSVPRPSVANIESLEALYPLLYLYRRIVPDSGGPGRFRGGPSAETAMTPYETETLQVTVSTIGSDQSNSVGTAGGYPGAGANAFLARGTDVWERLKAGPVPVDLRDLRGSFRALPAKQGFQLGVGDVFATQPHGGGGFGDPLERDPQAVLRDVLQGFVTPEWAARAYGVVLEGRGTLDPEATQRLRERRRRERLAGVGGMPGASVPGAPPHSGAAGGGRFGETLRIAGDGIVCARCGFAICGRRGGNPKAKCVVLEEELGAANPRIAVRWEGRSEKFHLVAYICPGCGALVDLHERRREETAHWEDCRLA